MAENTYNVVKDDSGKVLSVQADTPILDPNHPDAVQVLDQIPGNVLGSSADDQVVSTREDGTVSVGGNTVETGMNPVTEVKYDGDGAVASGKGGSKPAPAAKKSE